MVRYNGQQKRATLLQSELKSDVARFTTLIPGAPNENIVQNHANIALLNVF